MHAMVSLPLAQVGQAGLGLLFAVSLLAAMVGVAGLVWALIALWQENQPHRMVMRRSSMATRKSLWQGGGRRKGTESDLVGASRS